MFNIKLNCFYIHIKLCCFKVDFIINTLLKIPVIAIKNILWSLGSL